MLVASHSPHPLCCLKFGAILLALSLFFIVMMPSPFVEASVYAMPQISILDNAVDKVTDKLNKAVDDSAEKLSNKVTVALDKGWNWLMDKILAFMFFLTEIVAIIGGGWLLSLLCDKDSRKAIRVLVILCVISVVIDKIVSLKSLIS